MHTQLGGWIGITSARRHNWLSCIDAEGNMIDLTWQWVLHSNWSLHRIRPAHGSHVLYCIETEQFFIHRTMVYSLHLHKFYLYIWQYLYNWATTFLLIQSRWAALGQLGGYQHSRWWYVAKKLTSHVLDVETEQALTNLSPNGIPITMSLAMIVCKYILFIVLLETSRLHTSGLMAQVKYL